MSASNTNPNPLVLKNSGARDERRFTRRMLRRMESHFRALSKKFKGTEFEEGFNAKADVCKDALSYVDVHVKVIQKTPGGLGRFSKG